MRRRLAFAVVLFASRAYAQPAPPDAGAPPADQPATPPADQPTTPPSEQPAPPTTTTTTTPITTTTTPAPTTVSPPATPAEVKHSATQKRIAAQRICDAHSPDCDWINTFSTLERISIRRSLQAQGLTPEPMPWGKIVHRIIVVNEDVFAERGSSASRLLSFLNFFHVTTKPSTIRRELTFDEGNVYDPDLIAESARRLKDPLFTSVVAILPVKAAAEGQVDVLVVTRDIWSLRLNTKWTIQENSLTNFQMSLSENNFLGRRKTVAFGFVMSQGSLAVGPLYIDKNFLGKHLNLSVQVRRILTRQSLDMFVFPARWVSEMASDVVRDHRSRAPMLVPTGDPTGIEDGGGLRSEGSDASLSLSKPLWSLASKWGGATSFSYSNAISRSYLRTGLRAYDDPATPDADALAREYRKRQWSAAANAVRRWGDNTLKQQLSIGYNVSSLHPSLLPGFTIDPMLRADFMRDVFPHSEVVSAPYVEYSFFVPKYESVRNVDTYELGEDVQLGPNAAVGLSQSIKALGSTYNFTSPSISGGWTFQWGDDGFARVSGSLDARIQPAHISAAQGSHDTIDNSASLQVRAATPTYNLFRIVGQVHADWLWHDTQNNYFTLGSESGLRGYSIGQLIGDRRIVGQVEARGTPFPLWVLRTGAVVFYEGGSAADTFGQMRVLHDVGFGLRALVPQSSRELFRFDLAFPIVAAPGVHAGIPRFTAGFESYF